MLATQLANNWWVVALRGVLALLFGVALLVWPGPGLAALVILFGAYAFVDGVFSVVAAFRAAGENRRWWPLALEGVTGIAAGGVAFLWPGITAIVLLYIIAAWAVVTGIFEVVQAIRLREEIENEWWLALSGVLSVLFGLFLMFFPGPGALAVVWIVGAYAVLFGIMLLALAWRLWDLNDRVPAAA